MSKNENVDNILNPSVTIQKIKFNDGTEIELASDDIVVFVGPNNVGKSRALKDIRSDIIEADFKKIIIDEIQYKTSNFNEVSMKRYFNDNYFTSQNGSYEIVIDNCSYGFHNSNFENVKDDSRYFYKALFNYLSTENRLEMSSPISFSYVNDKLSFNIMRKLEKDKYAIKKLNDILLSCFNRAVDIGEGLWQNAISKLYKFGTKEEIDLSVNSDTREARCLLESLENLNDQGDGVRSAVSILSSLIASDSSLYLIDEPETFLHPPQARVLGGNIVDLSSNKQCFISTHNIDLLRGIIEKESSRVKIIKIDRVDNSNSFSVLDNDSLVKIATDRNLKYSNILNGLFYNQVALCENESDCKFYSALLEMVDVHVYQNTLFCAVGGKDQFKIIVPLLNRLKINSLIIADLDLINDKDKLKALLNSINSDFYDQISESHNEFLTLFQEGTDDQIKKQEVIKQEILQLFNDDKYMSDDVANKIRTKLKNINHFKLLKNSGKSCIPSGKCVAKYKEIVSFLNNNNIYVVECGEIEKFIPDVDGHGPSWVEEVLEKYHTLNEPEYDMAKEFIKKVFKIELSEEGENNE